MTTWKIKKYDNPKLKNTILVEGLPGIGNVGKIATDFIIDNLKAKKFLRIYCYAFPHTVFINDENLVELPIIEMYYKKGKKNDLILVSGDIQPIDEESCYEFCEETLNIFQKLNGKEIITLGGIGLQDIPVNPKVFCTANNKKILERYKKYKFLDTKIYGIVGPVVGVSGLLVGLAKEREIPAVSLLTETFGHPNYLGIKSARETLKALDKILNLNLNLKQLDTEINEIEREFKKSLDMEKILTEKKVKPKDTTYIG